MSSAWKKFQRVKVELELLPSIKPRYSLTSDILGFRRCPRQYGFFAVRGYMPAHALQLFYGTIIHEVLDLAHKHYKGLEDPRTRGKIPTSEDIESYFNEVDSALKARNIRAVNWRLRTQALKVLKKFNAIEGPSLYPRVVDTEHRVQGDRGSHIVEGVIDVLVDPITGSKEPGDVEIWDYKGARIPDAKHQADLESYRYQMLVYAALYKIRNGCYPKRAVLYFINELVPDNITARPKKALYAVELDDKEIQKALKEFDKTARSIRECREKNQWVSPPTAKLPAIEDTCAICDIRWSCKTFALTKPNLPYP